MLCYYSLPALFVLCMGTVLLSSIAQEPYGRVTVGATLDTPTNLTGLLAPTLAKAATYLVFIGVVAGALLLLAKNDCSVDKTRAAVAKALAGGSAGAVKGV